jgi:hypothetical protein
MRPGIHNKPIFHGGVAKVVTPVPVAGSSEEAP